MARAPIVVGSHVLLFTPGCIVALDAATGAEQWRWKVGKGTVGMPLPVAHGGILYIGSDGNLAALSLQDGTVL